MPHFFVVLQKKKKEYSDDQRHQAGMAGEVGADLKREGYSGFEEGVCPVGDGS